MGVDTDASGAGGAGSSRLPPLPPDVRAGPQDIPKGARLLCRSTCSSADIGTTLNLESAILHDIQRRKNPGDSDQLQQEI